MRLTGCFYLLDQDKRHGSDQLQCDIADAFLNTDFLENLEEWRKENLTKAFSTVQEYEKEIFEK